MPFELPNTLGESLLACYTLARTWLDYMLSERSQRNAEKLQLPPLYPSCNAV
jgi:hypothetical protein